MSHKNTRAVAKQRLKTQKKKVSLVDLPYIFPTQGGFAVFTVDICHGV